MSLKCWKYHYNSVSNPKSAYITSDMHYNKRMKKNSTKERLKENQSKGEEKIRNEIWMLEYQHLPGKYYHSHEPKHKDSACTTHNWS